MDPGPWRQTSRGFCNRATVGWMSTGGCGRPAAYEISLPNFTLFDCLEHHRELLARQEQVGKIKWKKEELPDGSIRLIPYDPYKKPTEIP